MLNKRGTSLLEEGLILEDAVRNKKNGTGATGGVAAEEAMSERHYAYRLKMIVEKYFSVRWAERIELFDDTSTTTLL